MKSAHPSPSMTQLMALVVVFAGLMMLTGEVRAATLLGVRAAFGATNMMESYTIDSATRVTTALPTPSFAFTGGWGDRMFAVDAANNKFYVATDPSGSGGATLYTANLTTGALESTQTLSGAAPPRIDAMKVLSDGTIFGVRTVFGATNTLEPYLINPATGAATALTSFSFTGSWGDGMFAVDEANAKYYIASTTPTLYQASLTTGALQNTTAITGMSRVDIMSVLGDGSILALDLGAGLFESYSLNSTTAVATALPTSSFAISGGWGEGMFAVDELSDQFFLATDPSGSPPANFYTIGLSTGGALDSGPLGGAAPIRIDAMDVIPEPASLVLLASGMLGLLRRRQEVNRA